MAKIKLFGDAAVIISGIKLETIKQLRKVDPKALYLYEGEGDKAEPVFGISISKDCGGMSARGVIFTGADDDGFATVTTGIAPFGLTNEQKLELFRDTHALPLVKLNALEAQITQVAADLTATLDDAMESIEIAE